jgi:phage tail protein X
MRAERNPEGKIVITMGEHGYQRLMAMIEAVDLVNQGTCPESPMIRWAVAARGASDLEAALKDVPPVFDFDAMLDALQSDKFKTEEN